MNSLAGSHFTYEYLTSQYDYEYNYDCIIDHVWLHCYNVESTSKELEFFLHRKKNHS